MPVLSRRVSRPAGDPVAEFLRAKTEFDALLAELAALSADHFGVDPERLNWGHVGTMREYLVAVRRVADSAFGRGEYAPAGRE